MKIWYIGILWCIIGKQQQGVKCQELGKSQSNSYFYLKQNGGYEYAFNTDTGLQSAQTADQSNEVRGHYMYYDKGVPYMVKYRAGVHGFQPEIIPADQLTNENFGKTKLQNFNAVDNSLNTRDIRTSLPLQDNQNPNSYRLTQQQQNPVQSPKVASYNIGQDTTLNFVQNALKTMKTQPMHLSFNSGLGEIQHPSAQFSTTLRPPIASTLLQPVTRNDVQDINNLAAVSATHTVPIHPYSFNYNADQSARSETSDPSGNVIGSYSYYDEAGYHDISYKANDNTGFVVLGGNLVQNQPPPSQLQTEFPQQHSAQQAYSPHPNQLPQQRRQLFRNNNFNFNNFRFMPDPRLTTHALDERNLGKRSLRTNNNAVNEKNSGNRSLRKFRRYAKW